MKDQQKTLLPEEGVRSVKSRHKTESDNAGKSKIDPKKLIIYSEIMRPKF